MLAQSGGGVFSVVVQLQHHASNSMMVPYVDARKRVYPVERQVEVSKERPAVVGMFIGDDTRGLSGPASLSLSG